MRATLKAAAGRALQGERAVHRHHGVRPRRSFRRVRATRRIGSIEPSVSKRHGGFLLKSGEDGCRAAVNNWAAGTLPPPVVVGYQPDESLRTNAYLHQTLCVTSEVPCRNRGRRHHGLREHGIVRNPGGRVVAHRRTRHAARTDRFDPDVRGSRGPSPSTRTASAPSRRGSLRQEAVLGALPEFVRNAQFNPVDRQGLQTRLHDGGHERHVVHGDAQRLAHDPGADGRRLAFLSPDRTGQSAV